MLRFVFTGHSSIGDPHFVETVESALGVALELRDHEPFHELTLDPDDLTRLRGFAAEVEVRGHAPTHPYPTPLHYPTLAQIDASRAQTERFRHLIHVTGSMGLYIPIDFPKPTVLPNLTLVGSLDQLAEELQILANAMEIPADIEVEKPLQTNFAGDPFAPEKSAFTKLLWATKACQVNHLIMGFE